MTASDTINVHPRSFMGVPFAADARGARAAILGVPFDCGTHPVRIGSRLGPDAIREQSALVRPYVPPRRDWNPLERLRLVDCGNVRVVPGNVDISYPAIEEAVGRILDAGAAPVTMGGDGAVTLPQLRAVAARHRGLAVLHVDAHTDTYPDAGYNTATTFTRAAEEGLLDLSASYHVGCRGPVYMPEVFEHTRQKGYRLVDYGNLVERGIPDVLGELRRALAGRPVYLCFDMDFFDPSCAPGVCTPAWGGATAREGLAFLEGLAGLDIVACDVNTVSPPHDVGGMTAFLAATVLLECLYLVAEAGARRGG